MASRVLRSPVETTGANRREQGPSLISCFQTIAPVMMHRRFPCAVPALTLLFVVSRSPAGAQQPDAGQSPTLSEPFKNSLGMKFVPLKATPGVWWSTLETREKDYAVYCQETGEGWRKPEFVSGPDYPVVNVTPASAAEFCVWLTLRE